MFLVQFSDNWADEIDVEGCMIMTDEEYEAYLAAARRAFEVRGEVSFCIGTNESIEWESIHDFEKTLFARYITEEEATVLNKCRTLPKRNQLGKTLMRIREELRKDGN